MADTFNPDEFSKFKAKATLDESTGFDHNEFSSFKDQQPQAGGGQLSLGQTVGTLAPALFGSGAPLETPWSRFSSLFPKAGGAVAEASGKLGLPAPVGALAGTEISMIPDVVAALGALKPTTSAATRLQELANSGSRIGAAEQAAGVITKAADKYPTSGNVGEVLNTLESQLQNGTLTDPQQLQQANSIVRFVFNNPNIVGKEKAVTAQAARVGQMVNQAYNAAVPGRAAASADYATLMRLTAPARAVGNAVANNYKPAAAGAGMLYAIKKFLLDRGH